MAAEQRRGAGLQRLWTLLQAARDQSTSVKEERGHPIQEQNNFPFDNFTFCFDNVECVEGVLLKCSDVQEEEAKECKWSKGAAKAEQSETTSPNCTLKGSGTATGETRLRTEMAKSVTNL